MPSTDAKSQISQYRWLWPYGVAIGLVVIDQLSKVLAVANLADGPASLLPFLSFRYYCNTGAAFSILQDFTTFLTAVGVVFVIYFSWEIWRLRKTENPPIFYVLALTLILAGAAGNLIDRATQGCVVDFIHVHYGWFNFPIFNIADMCVCFGAASWILEAILMRNREKQSKSITERASQ